MMIWTAHAIQRGQERFPGVNLNEILNHPGTNKATKNQLADIVASCPGPLKRVVDGITKAKRFYRVSRCGICFVMEDEMVVTVFKLDGKRRTKVEVAGSTYYRKGCKRKYRSHMKQGNAGRI